MSIILEDNLVGRVSRRAKSVFINCDRALNGNYQATIIFEKLTYVKGVVVSAEELPPVMIDVPIIMSKDPNVLGQVLAVIDSL